MLDLKNSKLWIGKPNPVFGNRAMSLETYILVGDEVKSIKLAQEIAKSLSSSRWMSTQTTAYSLLAMGKLMVKNGGKLIKVEYEFKGKKEVTESSKTMIERNLDVSLGSNSIKLKNRENNTIYVSIINKGKLPFIGGL